MKKIIGTAVTFIVLIAIIIDGYFLFIKNKLIPTATTTKSNSTSQTNSSANSNSTNNASKYKDGTYTGKATATRWGDVQVQATFTNNKMTNIKVLEYPNDNDHDEEINSQALPTYKSEALTKQSANIKLVSGASETYKGFTGSLQSAIDQAEA